jgi:hypothetical protein
MKPFSIFRKGKHTAMSGATLEFSEDKLKAAVAAYDPALHEAPMVVGHPKDNAPAYGWIQSLSFNEETGEISVVPHQVDESFADMVKKNLFKKRSASWYLPDSPNNPKPGTLYLRHVGFLGAMPPAVKGLKDVAFAEEGAVTIEFADKWTWGSIASLFRGIRDFIISEKDLETADRVIPNYLIGDLDRAANEPTTTTGFPSFSEDSTMTPEQIAALQARVQALETENGTLKTAAAKFANFAEQETALQTREAAVTAAELKIARVGVEARVDATIKAGKLLPANKASTVNFAMGLADKEATIEFTEVDKSVKKITQREAYLRQLEAGVKIVDYTELSAPDGSAPSDKAKGPQEVADRARQIQAKAKETGKELSFTEACAQASAEFSAE